MSEPFDFAGSRLLTILAHPDDEAFGASGSFAILTDAGAGVTLVCATRGEVGEISDPALATPENLGAVREQELFTATSHVGVTDVRFLDYRDSGMDGTEENQDPRAFVNAGPLAIAARIRAIIDEIRPDAILTFGPDGIYGHPDHLMAGRATTAAVLTAAWQTPALYYAAMPRELFEEMAAREAGPFADMAPEIVAHMGTPSADIDVWVDVKPQIDRKFACLMSHRTQMSPEGPMPDVPRDAFMAALSVETFLRIPLPWKTPVDGLLERLPTGPRTRTLANKV